LCQSQQFVAVSAPTGAVLQWAVDGVAGGTAATGVINATGLYTAPQGAAGTHTITASATGFNAQATAAVTDLAAVAAFHNDNARTGANLQEYALTPTAVASDKFGKLWTCPLDGAVYAQPLYVAHLVIGGATHNVLYVATHNDSVYAFDADDPGCTQLWKTSFLGNGATLSVQASCTDTLGGYGITPTPVIDIVSQRIYVLAATTENGQYVQRLHALNLATGADSVAPVAIQATLPSNPSDVFDASQERPRAGLALADGGVFLTWAAFCDRGNWHGWLMRYDATTLAQTAVFDAAPNGGRAGIWMSSGAPAFDAGGQMYLTTGNGAFTDTANTLPAVAPNNDFGMAVLKFDTFNSAALDVADYFVPSQNVTWTQDDYDVSAAGVTVLPDGTGPSNHPNLLISGDKQGHIYVLDRTDMGQFGAASNDIVQFLTLPNVMPCAGHCFFATPTYYNSVLYYAVEEGPLMAVPVTNGLVAADATGTNAVETSESTATYLFPSVTPVISAAPGGGGVVWTQDNSNCGYNTAGCPRDSGPATLDAYDAGNLATALFSSSTLAANHAGSATNTALKFNVPVVANGHVYVVTNGLLTVYGLAR
jgi:hypothetical protein